MASTGNTCCVLAKLLLAVVLGLAIPIACIVIASKYDDDCPAQPLIVIYLWVSGVFCAFKGIQAIIAQVLLLCGKCNDLCLCCFFVMDIILGLFLFAWFIAGSVWVYKINHKYSVDPADPNYCHPTLYKFAFGILTAQWVLIGLQMLVSMIAKCCGCEDSSSD